MGLLRPAAPPLSGVGQVWANVVGRERFVCWALPHAPAPDATHGQPPLTHAARLRTNVQPTDDLPLERRLPPGWPGAYPRRTGALTCTCGPAAVPRPAARRSPVGRRPPRRSA